MNNIDNDDRQEIVRSSSTSLQTTESLPVLAAFSDFIKEEQRRSRNRMLIMGFLFTIMIIIVIGAGVFVGTAFYNQVHADLRQTKDDLNSYHIKTEIAKSKTEEKLAQIQSIASNIAYNISQQKQALQETQKSIISNKDSYQQELADMKQVIDTLSTENKKLKKETRQAVTQLPELTAQINDLLSIISSPVATPATEADIDEIPQITESKSVIAPAKEKKRRKSKKEEKSTKIQESPKTEEAANVKVTTELIEPPELIKNQESLELNIGNNSDNMMLMPIPE